MKVQIKVSGAATDTQWIFQRAVVITMCCVLSIVTALPAKANYAALVMDATSGRVLYEANADLMRYPASLTKMMTLYLLFEALEKGALTLDDRVPISEHAASRPPTKLGVRPGQSIGVEDAILAIITKSANDIAAAVAERLGGSESRFAWTMTERAHQLGMTRTNFVNASGLPDPDQMTTARDMAILGLALVYHFPQYYPYFSTDEFYYGGAVHANHNRLLGSYYGLDGIKTGYTAASGYNLVASAVRQGRRLIGVVLGARSLGNRSIIMTSLLDQAFDRGQIIEVRVDDVAPSSTDVQIASLTPSQEQVDAAPPELVSMQRWRTPAGLNGKSRRDAITASDRSRAASRATARARAMDLAAHTTERLVRGRSKSSGAAMKLARAGKSSPRSPARLVQVAANDRIPHVNSLVTNRKIGSGSTARAHTGVAVTARLAAAGAKNKPALKVTAPSPRPAGHEVKASYARGKAKLRVSDDRRRSS